jgi:hypothetical protein
LVFTDETEPFLLASPFTSPPSVPPPDTVEVEPLPLMSSAMGGGGVLLVGEMVDESNARLGKGNVALFLGA